MAKLNSTYQQSSFLGGEASPAIQGRSDDPRYKTWLSAYKNAYPTEQGAWTRRDGTQGIIPTRNRNYAKLLDLESASALPYVMEFTDGALRFIYGMTPTYTADSQPVTVAVGGAGNLTLTTAGAHGYSAGDDVMLWFANDKPLADEGGYRGQVLQCVAGTTGSTIVVGDEVGNPTIFNNITLDGSELVFRIAKLSTTISSGNYPTTLNTVLQQLRGIQTDNSALIVQGNLIPQQVTIATAPVGINDAQFAISAPAFLDGPYASLTVDTGTVSALSGNTVTFTPRAGSYTFTSDDVGKQLRLFSEPAAWASGTTYAAGALIRYNGGYYQSTQGSNTGNTPGAPNLVASVLTQWWVAVLNVQRWVWGTIQSQSGTACVFNYGTDLSNLNGLPVGATNVIPTGNGTTSITSWQLGLWSVKNGYPINGCFHEGRLILLGPVGNRWDASVSNQIFTYSPTDQYGNVNDNTALSETLNSADVLYWAKPDDRGVVVGAQKGEWLISGGAEGDPLTATNAKARRVTRFRCAPIEPVQIGSSLVFAQFYKKHLYEYLIDSFSNRFTGKPLNDIDMPITDGNIAELAVTREPTPRVWVRTGDFQLVTCTYQRVSRFITEAPLYDAMNPHSVGDGRIVEALCANSNPGGGDAACTALEDPALPIPDITADADLLYLVTNDAPDTFTGSVANNRMIEVLRPQREAEDFASGWYVDQSPGAGKHLVGNAVVSGTTLCMPIGGLKGSDSQVAEPADIGERATATPGVAFPNTPGDTTRVAALLPLGDAVWFNGYSALFNLPRVSNSTGLTLSVWLNIDGFNGILNAPNTGPSSVANLSTGPCCQGALLGAQSAYRKSNTTPSNTIPSPGANGLPCPIYITAGNFSVNYDASQGRTVKVTGPAFRSDGTQWLAPGATGWCTIVFQEPKYHKVAGITNEIFRGAVITPTLTNSPLFNLATNMAFFGDGGIQRVGPSCPFGSGGFGNFPIAAPFLPLDNGWFNLLVSIRPYIPGTVDPGGTGMGYQFYVNDTLIVDTTDGNTWASSTSWQTPTKVPLSDLVGWFIGGRCPVTANPDSSIGGGSTADVQQQDGRPQDGTGLVSAMTELWIAPTGLDMTVAGNRNKFHALDLAALTYAPTDLGARGQTPTGSKPWIYCTGGPKVFHLNRAKKNAPLAVYNNFPDIEHQVANALDDEIFLDVYQPGPPS